MRHILTPHICLSERPCIVHSSISSASLNLPFVGDQRPEIVTEELHSERYLQHSAIQLFVRNVCSYLGKLSSGIRVAVPHPRWVYSMSICYRYPVVSCVRRIPIRYCNWSNPSAAARWSRPNPPYLLVPNTTLLDVFLLIPIFCRIALTTGLCSASHYLMFSDVTAVPQKACHVV
jgi:hypothetical protein